MVGWFVGCLSDWLVGWFGWLVGLVGWLVWFVGWLVGLLGLVGWLVGRSVGRLVETDRQTDR